MYNSILKSIEVDSFFFSSRRRHTRCALVTGVQTCAPPISRSDDRFLVLAERREVARRLKADLFISVHADSAANPDAQGATVYTLSEVASDREAARLAARENQSDIINGIDLGKEASGVTSILIDLARRDTMRSEENTSELQSLMRISYAVF